MNARALQVTLETCNYEEYLHVQINDDTHSKEHKSRHIFNSVYD